MPYQWVDDFSVDHFADSTYTVTAGTEGTDYIVDTSAGTLTIPSTAGSSLQFEDLRTPIQAPFRMTVTVDASTTEPRWTVYQSISDNISQGFTGNLGTNSGSSNGLMQVFGWGYGMFVGPFGPSEPPFNPVGNEYVLIWTMDNAGNLTWEVTGVGGYSMTQPLSPAILAANGFWTSPYTTSPLASQNPIFPNWTMNANSFGGPTNLVITQIAYEFAIPGVPAVVVAPAMTTDTLGMINVPAAHAEFETGTDTLTTTPPAFGITEWTYGALGSPATVTGLSPNNGPMTGGTVVTITGTGFTSATEVNFGSTPAASFTITNDTQIIAVSPAHSPVIVDVTIVNGFGTSPTGPSDEFTFTPVNPTFTFDGTSSTDPLPGRVVSWNWFFDDDTTAVGPVVSKVYTYGSGDHTVTLLVIDNKGLRASITHTITA